MTASSDMVDVHIEFNDLSALAEHGPKAVDRRVVEHVAECGECRSALTMISEIRQEMAQEADVEHPDFGGKRAWWKVLASAAALAAGLFIVFGGPMRERWFGPKGTEALAEASKSVSARATDGRLSGFPYQHLSRMRGPSDDETDDFSQYTVDAAAAKILRDPEANPHATAVAYLVRKGDQGRPYAGVVPYFEKALAGAKSPEERRAVANDLAVALLEQGSDGDLARALSILEGLWREQQTPEVAFNRAKVLERLQRNKEAVAAWNDYLRLDKDSEWAKEAVKYRDLLLELDPELRRP